MSYAIEVKKRKFERILESLTDGAPTSTASSSTTSRTSLNSRNNNTNNHAPPVQANQASGPLELSKRRRVTPSSVKELVIKSTASLSAHYLPSSRTAFLDRLETYRNVTRWHIPSTSVLNAAEWSKRGWVCQDTDTVCCPSCKEKLVVNLDVRETPNGSDVSGEEKQELNEEDESDALEMANAVYENLIKRYYGMIVEAHKDGCPWRRRGCDNSIQRIEGLLNTQNALAGVESRYQSMINQAEPTPQVATLPSTASYDVDMRELGLLELKEQQHLDANALSLAICGWQQKEADVVECRHCFRSLGMWLYRGVDPTMDHLDPIDSHLEYCPWRSSRAQDTEVTTSKDSQRETLAGWRLVWLAIVRDNTKRKPPPRNAAASRSESTNNDEEIAPEPVLTPEQRERKLKDLFRRVRELKKPFNVRQLLRKKEKPVLISHRA